MPHNSDSSPSLDTLLDETITREEVEDDYEGEDEATPIEAEDDPEGEGVGLDQPTDIHGSGQPVAWSRDCLTEASRGVKDSTFNKYHRFVCCSS